jgi:hypothetical protein
MCGLSMETIDPLKVKCLPVKVLLHSFGLTLLVVILVIANADSEAEENNENQRMERLAGVQADPAERLAEFTTDGCSGGLTSGWLSLAKLVPAFNALFGERPFWEQCCVEHDYAYWRGETVDGYAKRMHADVQLRRCVSYTGRAMSEGLSVKLDAPPEDIVKAFDIAAELMYDAVRAGGKPCTDYSWRWGYGWSLCPKTNRSPADWLRPR